MASPYANNVIELDDDDGLLDMVPGNSSLAPFLIDDSDSDDEGDVELVLPPAASHLPPPPLRNADPTWPEHYVQSCKLEGELARSRGPRAWTVRLGDTVELQQSRGPPEQLGRGDFLRILRILENAETKSITLRGLRLRRNGNCPSLPQKMNEVYMELTVDEDDPRPLWVQSLEDVPVGIAVRKRTLKVTNLPFPADSWRETTYYNSNAPNWRAVKEDIKNRELLTCRNILVHVYSSGERSKKRLRAYSGFLIPVPDESVDDRGGMMTVRPSQPIDLTRGELEPRATAPAAPKPPSGSRPAMPTKSLRYKYADAFSGGGGAACGAKQAGLRVKWSFDHFEAACDTIRRNFSAARVFNVDAHQFITQSIKNFDASVDILHISPPCQFFSGLRNGVEHAKNDDANTAAISAVEELLKRVQPRMVTLEETGDFYKYTKHEEWVHRLFGMFVATGYSIRWKLVNLSEHGVPQSRRRFVLIAAAPGLPLPTFPKPTHGPPGSGLFPLNSPMAAAGHIYPWSTHHDIAGASKRNGDPWDPRELSRTITTSNGSGNPHWSGKRAFTNRELACIQTFPQNYEFAGTKAQVETQIGNACPPAGFKPIFESCIETLRRFDDERGARGAVKREGPAEQGEEPSRRTASAPEAQPPLPASPFTGFDAHAGPSAHARSMPRSRSASRTLSPDPPRRQNPSVRPPSRPNGHNRLNPVVLDEDDMVIVLDG